MLSLWPNAGMKIATIADERKSAQAHIPHAPTLLESAAHNDCQIECHT